MCSSDRTVAVVPRRAVETTAAVSAATRAVARVETQAVAVPVVVVAVAADNTAAVVATEAAAGVSAGSSLTVHLQQNRSSLKGPAQHDCCRAYFYVPIMTARVSDGPEARARGYIRPVRTIRNRTSFRRATIRTSCEFCRF